MVCGGFVALGVELSEHSDWVVYFFGVLLLLSAVRMQRGEHEIDPDRDPMVRLVRSRLPTTRHMVGPHLFVRAREIPEADQPERPPVRGAGT